MSKADFNPSGTIKSPPLSDIFNSPSYRKMRAKALAYDPLKGRTHIAKAPPSPNRGEKATQRLAKKADFFVGQVPAKRIAAAPAKPAKVEARVTPKPRKTTGPRIESPYASIFNSPSFRRSRQKALSYDPLRRTHHVTSVPSHRPSEHARVLKQAQVTRAKAKRAQPKPQPGMTAAYTSRPGQLPVFEPARVVKNQAQLGELLRKGHVDLFSAIAYCDTRGQVHTGSVLEIYSMLPSRSI